MASGCIRPSQEIDRQENGRSHGIYSSSAFILGFFPLAVLLLWLRSYLEAPVSQLLLVALPPRFSCSLVFLARGFPGLVILHPVFVGQSTRIGSSFLQFLSCRVASSFSPLISLLFSQLSLVSVLNSLPWSWLVWGSLSLPDPD